MSEQINNDNMEILEGVFPSCSTILKSLFYDFQDLALVFLVGASIPVGSTSFSFPLVLVLDLSLVMRTRVVVVVGGEITGEKILHVLVTLLELTILMTSASSLLIQESCFIL